MHHNIVFILGIRPEIIKLSPLIHACILHTPCVTLRDDTERPETVQIGAYILAGTRPESILDAVDAMLHTEREWPNPFGEPGVSERIIHHVLHIITKIA